MFKDYYKILGICRYASVQEIKSAYHILSQKWHPESNPNIDVTNILIDLNEAYGILKSKINRDRYYNEYNRFLTKFSTAYLGQSMDNSSETYIYDYDIQDDRLKADIYNARRQAYFLVRDFLTSFKKFKETSQNGITARPHQAGIRVGPVASALIFILLLIALILGYAILQAIAVNNITQQQVKHYSTFQAPDSWNCHNFENNAFPISVPNTVELRTISDPYTKHLIEINSYNKDVIVFQQKGLSSWSKNALKHYCRIMIQYANTNTPCFPSHNEMVRLDSATISDLHDLVTAELSGFSLISGPSYQWIDIDGTKAIEIKYKRTGNDNNTTNCTMYLLFNRNEMVRIIISYREQEKFLWLPDLDKVIRTFKWK